MPSLELIADQLAQLIEAQDSPERRALAEVLTERLFQLLAVPPVPLELRVPFGNPFDAGVPLTEWCRTCLQSPATHKTALAPLLPIASLLDALGESDTPLFVFDPAWFRIDDRGRPLVFPPQLSLGVKPPGEQQLSERQRHACAGLVHSHLLQTLNHCDVRSALLYSFALFLARTLLNVTASDERSLLIALGRCRLHDRTLPPDLPGLLSGITGRPLNQAPHCTCRELAELALQAELGNPFLYRPAINRSTEHQVFAYSVFGLNKVEPVNEDRVLCRSAGAVSFALVADGVSMVDLGSGEMAAEEIVRLFRSTFQARFDTLADQLTDRLQLDPSANWTAEVELFLQDFFTQANERAVSLANQLRDPSSAEIPFAPLCATLTVAVVVFDQALLAFVGDSPALLFRRATGRLLQLSTEDHVGLDEDYDLDSGIDPHALTRVIGQCRFNDAKQVFETIPETIPVIRAQLQPGDLLLLGSDGLVECIDEATSQDRFNRLENELQRLHATDHPLRKLVLELVRLGEEGLSDDNISVTTVRIHGAFVPPSELGE